MIGLYYSHMQASTILLAYEYDILTLYVSYVATVKIEPIYGNVIVLLESHDDICLVVELFHTSPLLYRTKNPNPVLVFVDVDKIPQYPLYMILACHGYLFQHLLLHPSSSSSSVNIVDALKLTKLKK